MIKELQVHSLSLGDDKSPVVQQVLFLSIIIFPHKDPPVTVPVGSQDVCAPMGARAGGEDTRAWGRAAPLATSHTPEEQGLLLLGRARLKFFLPSMQKPALILAASG